ncbi:MAG: type II site-specific deoxyribonuclease [Ignavibacteria bacterium]|nr:MAG: type II site-specific deoxyribonuclease [Ignavibacteria bacterium]KAF0157780.1 MAG: type II site-specific deoxyribonuclease [Ignavibacteria bacterium]
MKEFSDEGFSRLISTLKENITTWDYFVNWSKVLGKISDIEIELNILNYLIGKHGVSIKTELANLLQKYPQVGRTVPILVAMRDENIKVLTSYEEGDFIYKEFSFKKVQQLTKNEIESIVEFADKTGFLRILEEKKIKNIVDFVVGVEVGLDSNGRKNRTGQLMENIIEVFVKKICSTNGFEYISQATHQKIKTKWNKTIKVDKSERKIDFAVYTKSKLFLIETNFYAGGGSKLKSTAGEYKYMYDYWKQDGHELIWITDGYGWLTAEKPLRETYDYINYLLNLNSVTEGKLESILREEV